MTYKFHIMPAKAAAKLDTLIEDVARQPPTFKVEWSFDGTRYFISHSEQLAASRIWLTQLLDALANKDRDTAEGIAGSANRIQKMKTNA